MRTLADLIPEHVALAAVEMVRTRLTALAGRVGMRTIRATGKPCQLRDDLEALVVYAQDARGLSHTEAREALARVDVGLEGVEWSASVALVRRAVIARDMTAAGGGGQMSCEELSAYLAIGSEAEAA